MLVYGDTCLTKRKKSRGEKHSNKFYILNLQPLKQVHSVDLMVHSSFRSHLLMYCRHDMNMKIIMCLLYVPFVSFGVMNFDSKSRGRKARLLICKVAASIPFHLITYCTTFPGQARRRLNLETDCNEGLVLIMRVSIFKLILIQCMSPVTRQDFAQTVPPACLPACLPAWFQTTHSINIRLDHSEMLLVEKVVERKLRFLRAVYLCEFVGRRTKGCTFMDAFYP